jgi:hypothetical protein
LLTQLQNLTLIVKSHVVLSGGLGSSQYVKNALVQRYTIDSVDRHAPEVRIISSTRPQLAVVKGLVQDRMRRLKMNKSVLSTRICRQSLGVLCWQVYNPLKPAHQRAKLETDPCDRKTYATNQVAWFVRQGQPISQDKDHIDRAFERTFFKDKREPWKSTIVICNSYARELPDSLVEHEGTVKPLCVMTSDLTSVPVSSFEKKKKRWWKFKSSEKSYFRACYTIRFEMKPAAIDSQLLFQDKPFSMPNSFEVRWEAGADMAAPKEHRQENRANFDRLRSF